MKEGGQGRWSKPDRVRAWFVPRKRGPLASSARATHPLCKTVGGERDWTCFAGTKGEKREAKGGNEKGWTERNTTTTVVSTPTNLANKVFHNALEAKHLELHRHQLVAAHHRISGFLSKLKRGSEEQKTTTRRNLAHHPASLEGTTPGFLRMVEMRISLFLVVLGVNLLGCKIQQHCVPAFQHLGIHSQSIFLHSRIRKVVRLNYKFEFLSQKRILWSQRTQKGWKKACFTR